MSLKVISLFTGAGGLDLGFEAAGFEISVAVEADPSCCTTLEVNKPRYGRGTTVICKKLQDVSSEEIMQAAGLRPLEAALVIGGPPCQPFSLAGERKGLDDPRGTLVKEFIRVVQDTLPTAFVIENVKGLLNWSGGKALKLIEEEASKPIQYNGNIYRFDLTHSLLNAADFGVPQMRERVFIVGNRIGIPFNFPVPTHGPKSQKHPKVDLIPYTSVWDAIGSLGPAEPPSDTARRVAGTIKGRIQKHGY